MEHFRTGQTEDQAVSAHPHDQGLPIPFSMAKSPGTDGDSIIPTYIRPSPDSGSLHLHRPSPRKPFPRKDLRGFSFLQELSMPLSYFRSNRFFYRQAIVRICIINDTLASWRKLLIFRRNLVQDLLRSTPRIILAIFVNQQDDPTCLRRIMEGE